MRFASRPLFLLGNDPVAPSNCSEKLFGAVRAIFVLAQEKASIELHANNPWSESNFDKPTPHISKKYAPKYGMKWGVIWRKNRWNEPAFMAYELRLLCHAQRGI